MELYNPLTQTVITEAEFRAAHPNTSFPTLLTSEILLEFNYIPVLESPKPTPGEFQVVVPDGVTISSPETIYKKWAVRPMFVEYTDGQGQVHTVQSQITAELNRMKLQATRQVDQDVDQIMRDCIGERATEYQRAETQARAFKAASYTGTPGKSVLDWARVKGWTNQQAADDIIAQADAWILAQETIREHRLQAKEDIRNATSLAGIESARLTWVAFSAYIRNLLGI